MFSGGDSSGNPLNAFACTSGGSIDWAQLAQQWIQMQNNEDITASANDYVSNMQIPCPPPPTISGKRNDERVMTSTSIAPPKLFGEQGEADMDMDEEEENTKGNSHNPFMGNVYNPAMGRAQMCATMTNVPKSSWPGANIAGPPLPPAISSNPLWNVWPAQVVLPTDQTPSTITQPTNTQHHKTSHIPSLLNLNVPKPNKETENSTESGAPLDAAKKKILPAWIREGLEKMEREKLKQMEKEDDNKKTHLSSEDLSIVSSTAEIMVNKNTAHILASEDEESSGNEAEYDDHKNLDGKPMISMASKTLEPLDKLPTVEKTYEQKLADLMIIVRRTLTELLLEVTNEEIAQVAQETVKSYKSKASSVQMLGKSALSITGKLGLSAYDDSSSDQDSDNESNSDKVEESHLDQDSEEEIRAVIRQKRRAFAKTSDEIEERIAQAALREEETLKYHLNAEAEKHKSDSEAESNGANEKEEMEMAQHYAERNTKTDYHYGGGSGKGYEKDFGETTESKLHHSNGKRQRERQRRERTTRFSDNKDSKNVTIAHVHALEYNVQKAPSSSVSTIISSSQTKPLYPLTTGTPDLNGLYTNSNIPAPTSSSSYRSTKSKSSGSKHSKHHSSEESDSSSSSESDSSSSSSSRNSKYSRTSSSKHQRRDRDDYYKDRYSSRDSSKRKHSSSSSSHKRSEREHARERDYYSTDSKRYRHSKHSESDNDDSHRSSSSRKHGSKYRSRSRSHSSYSSSSHRRH